MRQVMITQDDPVRCEECGWVGYRKELNADYAGLDFWSNEICPRCGEWHCLSDDQSERWL